MGHEDTMKIKIALLSFPIASNYVKVSCMRISRLSPLIINIVCGLQEGD